MRVRQGSEASAVVPERHVLETVARRKSKRQSSEDQGHNAEGQDEMGDEEIEREGDR